MMCCRGHSDGLHGGLRTRFVAIVLQQSELEMGRGSSMIVRTSVAIPIVYSRSVRVWAIHSRVITVVCKMSV